MNLKVLFSVALFFLMSQACLADEAADCSKFPIEIKESHPGSTIATEQQIRLILSPAQTACVKKTISGIRDYQSLFKCPDDSILISSTPVESIRGENRGQVQLSVYCKINQSFVQHKKNNSAIEKKNDPSSIPPSVNTPPATQVNPAAR